jgi:hypothetical protein
VLLSGTHLMSAEKKSMFVQTIKQVKAMDLSATALVFVNLAFTKITQRFWIEVYQYAGVNYGFLSQKNKHELGYEAS